LCHATGERAARAANKQEAPCAPHRLFQDACIESEGKDWT